MRISDWSSDVGSSDLAFRAEQARRQSRGQLVGIAETVGADIAVGAEELHEVEVRQRRVAHRQVVLVAERNHGVAPARKRVDEGKSVSESVDLGGRSIIKKKQKQSK